VDPNLRGVRGAVAVLLREGSGAAFYRGLGASMLGALRCAVLGRAVVAWQPLLHFNLASTCVLVAQMQAQSVNWRMGGRAGCLCGHCFLP